MSHVACCCESAGLGLLGFRNNPGKQGSKEQEQGEIMRPRPRPRPRAPPRTPPRTRTWTPGPGQYAVHSASAALQAVLPSNSGIGSSHFHFATSRFGLGATWRLGIGICAVNTLYAYADSNFESPKSTGGRQVYMNGAIISASAQRHITADTSTTAAELTQCFMLQVRAGRDGLQESDGGSGAHEHERRATSQPRSIKITRLRSRF
jgi:hypothetical protein